MYRPGNFTSASFSKHNRQLRMRCVNSHLAVMSEAYFRFLIIGGLAALSLAVTVEASPIISIVPEKSQLNQGESSYFDVYINSNGTKTTGIDVDMSYSGVGLSINNDPDLTRVLLDAFWQGKTLLSKSVNGQLTNIIGLKDLNPSTNYILAYDAAFRVGFTAGNDLGLINLDFGYASVTGYNDANVFTNYVRSNGLEVDGASIEVIPEPATLAMLGLGAGALALRSRKRK